VTREFPATGQCVLLIERGWYAGTMVVFDNDTIGDVAIERHLHAVLRVQAEPLPTVDAGATQIAWGVADSGVIYA
jgi:hypothetical protein